MEVLAMLNISACADSHNKSFSTEKEIFSKAQVIAWSCAFASEALVIVVGNLLAIVLFAFNKKLRSKKSLYFVMNMAFADLVLGAVFLPISIFFLMTHSQILHGRPIFLKIILTVFSQASSFTAALISAERFYAIYWPLKHRTLSTRAYRLVILTVWTLAIITSTVYLLLFLTPLAVYTFLCSYVLFLALTICGLNIGIWRKFQQKTPRQQNRALQNQRLTKALLFVSVFTLSSWIPISVYNFVSFFGYNISDHILLLSLFIYLSISFINPMVYALRIPEFKQALSIWCLKRQETVVDNEENTGRVNMAVADHNRVQLNFEQDILEGRN